MKRCLSCQSSYENTDLKACPHCNMSIDVKQGIEVYAPEYLDESEGFKAEYFDELFKWERYNFWFRARNTILSWAFKKHTKSKGKILEIGCGNGFVLDGLRTTMTEAELNGSEIFLNGLKHAAKRLPGVKLMQMDARNIPFVDHFDAIGAFDVLEHIQEDEAVLAQIHNALLPGGHLILSVPQHMWLWSKMDDYACHFRRYTAAELTTKFEKAGFKIERSTSFVFFLLPAMLASRMFKKNIDLKNLDASSELRMNPVLNAVFYQIMKLEAVLIKIGLNFPIGGSRLIIARKPNEKA